MGTILVTNIIPACRRLMVNTAKAGVAFIGHDQNKTKEKSASLLLSRLESRLSLYTRAQFHLKWALIT